MQLRAPKPLWRGRRTLAGVLGWTGAVLAFALVAFPLLDILYLITRRALSAFSLGLFTQVTNGISGGLLN
ncbi:MAG: phosphate ABC transporter permease PstA, partial [Acidiferrobacteraceae bacterium]